MAQEQTTEAVQAAMTSESSQMPRPSDAAGSAQSSDVVHAATTGGPNQIPSPSEAAESAYDDSSSPDSFSDSSCSWTDDSDPVDNFPRGYPKVAAYQHCEPGWLIFRKFGWLRNHALLDLQDELLQLEERLKDHNKYEYRRGNKDRLLSRRSDYERPNSRQPLMQQIHEKLEQYDNALLRAQKVQRIEGPSRRFQNGLYNCIHVEQNIMRSGTEEQWIRRSDDLASLSRDAEGGWLNAVVADCIGFVSRRLLMKLFRTEQQKIQTGSDKTLYLVDPHRVDMLLRGISAVLATGLAIMPAFIIVKLQPSTQSAVQEKENMQFLVILASTLLFNASCSVFTRAGKQDVFWATAAYAAVLVIVQGNASGKNSPPQ